MVEEKGLKQVSDEGQIRAFIEEVLKENPKEVESVLNLLRTYNLEPSQIVF